MPSFHPSVRRARRNARGSRDVFGGVPELLENRLLFAVMLWSENFEELPLGPSVEEPNAAENVWTKTPPAGWFKDDTGVPGYNNPDLPTPQPDNNGRTEWIGWTFTDKEWWSTQVDTQRRAEFTRGKGTVMVADPDEWDDEVHPGSGSWASEAELYNAFITTGSIPLAGAVPGTLAFELDSSWRPEGFDDGPGINNQTGIIDAIYSTGQTEEILHWDSDGPPQDRPPGPFYHDDNSTNEHVVLPLHPPAGATSVKFKFGMLHSANDWFWAVDNLALTGSPDLQGVRLIGVTGNEGTGAQAANNESLWDITYTTGANPSATATRFLGLPAVPDNDAIAFNPDSLLLNHISGGSSTSNTPSDPNYRDNHFMETINVPSGTNAMTTVFNANSEKYGSPGPFPSFVLPATRRTDAQTDPSFGDARGPGEYNLARDFTWSSADHAFYLSDYQGLFKLTPDGQSTFVGDPIFPGDGPGGITFFNVDGQRQLLLAQLSGAGLFTMNPANAEVIGDPVVLADADGNNVGGILSLVESPDGNTLLGLAKDSTDPTDPLKRSLVQIDPVSGLVTKLGTFNIPITDLAYVYSPATSTPVAQIQQVFVNGPNLTGQTSTNGVAFRTMAGIDNTYGYAVPAGANQTKSIPWNGGIDRVALRFTSDVATQLQQGDLVIRGINTATYTTTAFSYDPTTKTGMWTLSAPITNDKIRLFLDDAQVGGLDGEWANASGTQGYPSGNGTVGGDFDFRINILRGDATQDGQVNALDLSFIKQRLNKTATNPGTTGAVYSPFGDITSDGTINALDLSAAKQRLNSRLPTGEPATALLFSTRAVSR